MLVYRFEEEHTRTHLTPDGKEVTIVSNYGIFSSSKVTYTDDANYQTYGCTMYTYKESAYRFACNGIDKLIEYFGSDFARLIGQKNVLLVEYEVKREDCFFSSKHIELVFKADNIISRRIIA